LFVLVDSALVIVVRRFAGWVCSLSSFSSRARFLDACAGESGTGRSGELDERSLCICGMFLESGGHGGDVVGFKWYSGVCIVWGTPDAVHLWP